MAGSWRAGIGGRQGWSLASRVARGFLAVTHGSDAEVWGRGAEKGRRLAPGMKRKEGLVMVTQDSLGKPESGFFF